ncbi:MAG: hypothetical protein CSA66_05080 [Proteobacteria bacterium]|nr:MAG: hypothetical protein CSA66_05080 [Pseudomonadota bacterium]
MDLTPKTRRISRALGFAGHLALLLGFALVLFSGRSHTFATAALTAGAILGGFGWIRAAPDERTLAAIGGWFLALSPLMALWFYAALYPSKLEGALTTSTDVMLVMIMLFSLFAGVGILRIVPSPTPTYLIAGLGLVLNALATGAAVFAGGWDIVMVALVANMAVQAVAAAVFWPPKGLTRPASSG